MESVGQLRSLEEGAPLVVELERVPTPEVPSRDMRALGWIVVACCIGLLGCEEPKYGKLTPIIEDYKKQLGFRPCDADMAVKLAESYQRAGDQAAALAVFRGRGDSCEANDDLDQKHFTMEQKAGDKERALALAKKLHESTPKDDDRLLQLLDTLDAAGKKEELLKLLITEVARDIEKKDALVERLAKAYESNGDPCRALVWWSVLSLYSRKLRGHADTELMRLNDRPECKGYMPTKAAKITHEEVRNLYVFPATIEGVNVALGMDSATAFSYMSKAAFSKIPNTKPLGQRVEFRTAYGKLEGDLYQVNGVTLGEMAIGPFDMVVVPRLEDRMDGMLGASVQSRLRMTRADKEKPEWDLTPL